ncbi:hypothetical protein J5N97_000695 [Dioscorea zingiberensis]|uniref:RNase H type-1 domain-containing protein n=1 Tax=Dioscorea zingiberensis TaxID=325984 RepID=A0A9D5BVZ3_9LILI|nr:hypothetical protein J5N97_000695 [Dioscorea zingiberensis]
MAGLIWKNRNACRFGEKTSTGEQIALQAKEWLSNFHGANSSCSIWYEVLLEVESDDLNVIKAINSTESDMSLEGPVFDEVKSLKPNFEDISWKKIPIGRNKAAHYLAKEALTISGIQFWKEAGPPWLHDLAGDDMSS